MQRIHRRAYGKPQAVQPWGAHRSLSSVGRGDPRLVTEEPRLRPRGRPRMRFRLVLWPLLLPVAVSRSALL